jgi:hypothetical protein
MKTPVEHTIAEVGGIYLCQPDWARLFRKMSGKNGAITARSLR